MSKKAKSYRLSELSLELLSKIAKLENRSDTNAIETLILEKARSLGLIE